MRRKNLPLNALRAFEAAARLGRLTVAAEELGVTHGAVSRQVRQLESVLGVDLFGGPRSKPELTPTGQSLAPVLTAALDQIDNAVRAVLAEEEGLLQVACLSTLAMRWLIPRLHRFTQLHPGIDVRLSTDKEHIDPERGRFDLVITVIDGGEVLRARDALLFREQIGVAGAGAHAFREAASNQRPCINPTVGHAHQAQRLGNLGRVSRGAGRGCEDQTCRSIRALLFHNRSRA